ncbi:GNAT family N-acetyltransferase [Sandaracinobacteroides saxicola]|uniref:GNAT family N-acetyltransferase n=1 Tax=Sandaracinobacteroides saxicola TaxID=2759707 RepID=UPI001FB0856D|nr:GNAT family N-acetyltransferase [Sandaracinobacteroides saxicola]
MSRHDRDGGVADAAEVAALFARSFTATFGHLYPPEDLAGFLAGCDGAAFAGELADADHGFRLAFEGDALIGFVKLGPTALPIDRAGRRAIELRQLYVDEAAKGLGVAAGLMEWALAEAARRGMEDIYLTVWIDNHRARRFYERYGFVEVGRYAFVVGGTIDDDRIMRLRLA